MGSPDMTFTVTTGPWETLSADALVIPVWKTVEPAQKPDAKAKSGKKSTDSASAFQLPRALGALDKALQGMISATAAEEKFSGACGATLTFRKTPGDRLPARRVTLVGLGEVDKLTLGKLESAVIKAINPIWN